MLVALDAFAGASLLAVGVLGWRDFRASAAFATAAAAAWFVVPLVPSLALLHRPLLLHSILALPRARTRGVLASAALAAAWGTVVVPRDALSWAALLSAALCVSVVPAMTALPGSGPRPDVQAARRALLVLSAGLVLPVVERAMWAPYAEAGLPLATYLGAVLLCSFALLRGILVPSRAQADAVIELSDGTPTEALEELRGLADTELDRRRADAVQAAVALLEENARLQAELAERIDDVRNSRARLIDAAVGERRRLEQVLAEGALRYLGDLEECLTRSNAPGHDDPAVAACLREVADIREDLAHLARGLHPRVLSERGLAAALEDFTSHSPVPVEVSAPVGRLPERIEAAVWYACAETLANVYKHARATRAAVDVRASAGVLTASIRDDGVGGAVMAPGGGLSGLVDRLADIGGHLALSTTPGGTEVTVTVPVP